ncbi:hypothetical protein [Fictibacillus barbaricus]|nr:hypothetical protein [Fictibacillus barbaricus]GGB67789.1 hypothetical protein GCM10007199_37410 [Fictibacillus barbaricus]
MGWQKAKQLVKAQELNRGQKMNKNDLEIKLKNLGIEENDYNLGEKPIRDLEIGLMKEVNEWKVYQSLEKGEINIIDTFDNESDACELLLKYLVMRKNKKERNR